MARLIKNKLFILLMITLILFVVMGASSKQGNKINYAGNIFSVVLAPFQNLFSYIGDKVSGSFVFFQDTSAIRKENEALKLQIDELQKENKELKDYRIKNKELKEALNIKEQFSDYESLGSNIIAKDMGNWFNVFTVDRGKKDGVDINQPVITSKGLVGAVISSDFFSAKVLSIIDQDSSISARITKSRDVVVIKGDLTLKDQGLCRMEYIPADIDIAVGDKVETSGVGGIFPKGIIIGEVKEVRRATDNHTRYAIVKPSVDFKRLEEVLILKNKNKVLRTDSAVK